jgi:hypothetical protein
MFSVQLTNNLIPAAVLGMYLRAPHYVLGLLVFLGVVFWIFFCVLVAVYAGAKGRSGIGFFLLSVFLTPLIGFIIAVIMQPHRQKIAAHSA